MTTLQQPDGPRYASVSEQLLEMSLNKSTSGKLDRHALEKRLMELQGDVSRLVSKLSTRAKDDSASHHSSMSKLSSRLKDVPATVDVQRSVRTATVPTKLVKSRSLTSTFKPKTTQKQQPHATKPSKSTIPGSRMGNLIRLQSDLHAANIANDQLRFDLDQLRRTVDAHTAKLRDYATLQTSFHQLKAHCASLQQSLDLSETIRHRQKKIIADLKAHGMTPTTTTTSTLHSDNSNNEQLNDEDEPMQGGWPQYTSMARSPANGRLPPPPPIPLVTSHRVKKKAAKKARNQTVNHHVTCSQGIRRATNSNNNNSSFLAPTQASQQRLADTKQFKQLQKRQR
ncbi:hypothetical protein H257_00979 [Aphanomyces astaci]|uniref:Uncharacterized protein n=1 Tax=Aphanomyces astaci TaxID=112090 RepID=W4H726_APHAT|nr:hypothetical protein H257_00979 [Aphanomyces astaci]ETV87381.1 hypothetical protein H257_00979 [Aphanomyces astaci]|eukprot:XP_009822244.1 hypothetical protein H257_00979 [Aphanomyces astaci]